MLNIPAPDLTDKKGYMHIVTITWDFPWGPLSSPW